MKNAVTPKTHQDISKVRTDLDKTVDSVKFLMEDFYYFMNGTKNKAQPTMGSNANPWKIEPNVTKPLKDIILEAGAEQKREAEEDLRRKRNLIIHKAPESKSTEPKLRQNEDMSLIRELCASIEIEPSIVKNCTRLGKLSEDHENETRPRLLRITLETQDDAEHMMKNLTKLKYAKDELKHLRITPDRSMKERENVRFLVQRAKSLTAEEPGNFIHIVRGNKIIRVKKREITIMQRTTPETENILSTGSGM